MFYATKLQQLVEELQDPEKQQNAILQRVVEELQTPESLQNKKLQRLVGEIGDSSKLSQIGHVTHDTPTEGIAFPESFGYVPWGQHIAIIT